MLLIFTCHLWPSAPTLFSVVWHWVLLASKSSQMPSCWNSVSPFLRHCALCIILILRKFPGAIPLQIQEVNWLSLLLFETYLRRPWVVLFSMTWQVHTWCDELAIYKGCAWMGSGNHSAEIIIICLREHWCSTARCACIWGLFIYWGVCVSFGFHGMELCLLPHIALD